MADRRECYIPIKPDPDYPSRSLSLWQEIAERLGFSPTEPLNGEYRLRREDDGNWNVEGRTGDDDA